MKSNGQTSLEYLLIIVVIAALVVALVFWLQMTSSDITTVGNQTAGNYACAMTPCPGGDPDCQIPACPGSATCGPDGRCQI